MQAEPIDETIEIIFYVTPRTEERLKEQMLKGDPTLSAEIKLNKLIVEGLRAIGLAERY